MRGGQEFTRWREVYREWGVSELNPVDESTSKDIVDSDAAIHGTANKPFRVGLGETDIVDLVLSSFGEMSDSFET